MIRQNNLMPFSQFDDNAYSSAEAAELTLNAAILRADIARSYEEFLGIPDSGGLEFQLGSYAGRVSFAVLKLETD